MSVSLYKLVDIVDLDIHRRRLHRGDGIFAPVAFKLPGQEYVFAPVAFEQWKYSICQSL